MWGLGEVVKDEVKHGARSRGAELSNVEGLNPAQKSFDRGKKMNRINIALSKIAFKRRAECVVEDSRYRSRFWLDL